MNLRITRHLAVASIYAVVCVSILSCSNSGNGDGDDSACPPPADDYCYDWSADMLGAVGRACRSAADRGYAQGYSDGSACRDSVREGDLDDAAEDQLIEDCDNATSELGCYYIWQDAWGECYAATYDAGYERGWGEGACED